MRRKANLKKTTQLQSAGSEILRAAKKPPQRLSLLKVDNPDLRLQFDAACDEIHYAGSCKRVGRCMRLAITYKGEWAGGIVLGSTFPNIKPRDDEFGLSQFVIGTKERGLISPWARENKGYWNGLQLIVNHARTFIFPKFQGDGIGVAAHSLLLTKGKQLWEEEYKCEVYGFDTLCTHPGSKLFAQNGWTLVGRTQGYSRDPNVTFSKRAFENDWKNIKDNAGLGKLEGNFKWWIWLRVLKRFEKENHA